MEEDHIKVVCRIRPINEREKKTGSSSKKCVTVDSLNNSISIKTTPKSSQFTYDFVADEDVSQSDMFQVVGIPVTKACIEGYNGTIIAYGQTGSGKTHTMFGDKLSQGITSTTTSSSSPSSDDKSSGLVPRVLDYLWQHMARERLTKTNDSNESMIDFKCSCSFYEIYQEKVFDLLDIAGNATNANNVGLSVREDSKLGVYVDGAVEETVNSPEDAARILATGYRNRHVGCTTMNRESSRSHAVFSLYIEISEQKKIENSEGIDIGSENDSSISNSVCISKNSQVNKTEIVRKRSSRFTMIDLAGSERQRDTNATGDRLKEASNINKSLSALGNVINALADRVPGVRRHVHYRDSKLTFLLRDSLGGNSKTCLIAAISPVDNAMSETLSTLKFAQRAKSIRNTVQLNEETMGSTAALQKEVSALRAKLRSLETKTRRVSGGGPLSPSPRTRSNNNDVSGSPISKVMTMNDVGENNTTMVIPELLNAGIVEEALKRADAAEEQRLRAEVKNRTLTKRLEQSEKVTLSVKMQLKMRETEVARYRKKEKGASDTVDSNADTEMIPAADLESVREELLAEVLRHRCAHDELERRVRQQNQSSSNGNADMPILSNNLWEEAREDSFSIQLTSAVEKAVKMQQTALERAELLAGGRFEEAFGLTVGEAAGLRARVAECTTRAEAAEVLNAELRGALAKAQARVCDAEVKLTETETTLAAVQGRLKAEREDWESSMVQMQGDLEMKLEQTNRLENQLADAGEEKQKTLREIELEHRAQFNKLMKDNVVLLKTSRELEANLELKSNRLETVEHELQESIEQATQAATTYNSQLSENANKISNLENLMEDLQSNLEKSQAENSTIKADKDEITENMNNLQATVDRYASELNQLTLDLATRNRELEEIRETAEHQWQQCQVLEAARDELSDKVSQNEEQISQLEGDLSSTKEQNKELERLLASESDGRSGIAQELGTVMESLSMRDRELSAAIEAHAVDISRINVLEQKVKQQQQELQRGVEEEHALREAVATLRDKQKRLEDELAQALSQLDTSTEELCQAVRDKDIYSVDLIEAQSTVAKLETEILENKKLIDEKTHQVDSTQQLLVEMELKVKESDNAANQNAAIAKESKAKFEQLTALVSSGDTSTDVGTSDTDNISGMDTVRKALQEQAQERATLQVQVNQAQEARNQSDQALDLERKSVIKARQVEAELRGQLADALEKATKAASAAASLSTTHAELAELRTLYDNTKSSLNVLESERDGLLTLRGEVDALTEQLNETHLKLSVSENALIQTQKENENAKAQLNAEAADITAHKVKVDALTSKVQKLETQLVEAQADNTRLCGHQNTKQKIQAHMQLKKDIEDQAKLLRTQQLDLERVISENQELKKEIYKTKKEAESAEMEIHVDNDNGVISSCSINSSSSSSNISNSDAVDIEPSKMPVTVVSIDHEEVSTTSTISSNSVSGSSSTTPNEDSKKDVTNMITAAANTVRPKVVDDGSGSNSNKGSGNKISHMKTSSTKPSSSGWGDDEPEFGVVKGGRGKLRAAAAKRSVLLGKGKDVNSDSGKVAKLVSALENVDVNTKANIHAKYTTTKLSLDDI